MALERIGLGGVLGFEVGTAIKNMDRARDSLGRFVAGAQKVNPAMAQASMGVGRLSAQMAVFGGGMARGVGQLSSGVAGLGLAFAPFAVAVGLGVNEAMKFERQMQRVDAVTLGSAEDLSKLSNFALTAGLDLGYTGIEVGAGMEVMARAGAEAKDVVASLPSVMAAAAAEGISVEKAMDVAGVAMHTMGLNWENMGQIENVLARTSANTASSIESLGESFAYGGQAAHTAGLSIEQAAAIFGMAHDAGLKRSTAGTAFQNAIQSLAKPTEEGTALLSKWGVQMTHDADGALNFSNIIKQVYKNVDKLGTNLEKSRAVNAIFGVRGGRIAMAEATSQKKSAIVQEQMKLHPELNLEDNSTAALTQKNLAASKGIGSAMEMAKRQLDSLAGALSLVKSSFSTANVVFFQPLLKPLATLTRNFLEFSNIVLRGLVELRNAGNTIDGVFERLWTMENVMADGGRAALNVMTGVKDAIHDMETGVDFVIAKFKEFSKKVDETVGGDAIRNITRFSILFVTLAGMASPVLLGLRGMFYLLNTSIVPIISGLVTIVGTLASAITVPMVALGTAAAFAFAIVRRDGESVGDTLSRVFWSVTATAMQIWDDALYPLYRGIVDVLAPGLMVIGDIWNNVVDNVKIGILDFTAAFLQANESISVDWNKTGGKIGMDMFRMAHIASRAAELISKAFSYSASFIGNTFGRVFGWMIDNFDEATTKTAAMYAGIEQIFNGNLVEGFAKLGNAIKENMLIPIRAAGRALVGLMEIAGQGDKVPEWMRQDLAPRDFHSGDDGKKKPFNAPPPLPDNPKNYLGQFGAAANENNVSSAKPAPISYMFAPNAVANERENPTGLNPGKEFVSDPNKSFAENRDAREAHMKAQLSSWMSPNKDKSRAEIEIDKLREVATAYAAEKAKNPEIVVKNEVTDKRETNVNVDLHLDGKKIASSQQKISGELAERAGFRNTPWERRIGAANVGFGAGAKR